MQVIHADFSGSVKGYRYEFERRKRSISTHAGEGVNVFNRFADTAGNYISANFVDFANHIKQTAVNVGNEVGMDIAAHFSKEDSLLSVGGAKLMLVKGDHIRVRLRNKRGYFYHHGIYCGDGVVTEFNGRYPSENQYTIEECSLESFARGRRIEVDNREPSFYSPDEIVARAKSRLGERGYHLVYNNCETFATWCRSGPPLVRLAS